MMPMELYSSEAFARDIVNAISEAEGRPLNIGGNHHRDIDRDYAFQLISEAKKAIEGNFGAPAAGPANNAAAARTAAIMAAIKGQDDAPEPEARKTTRATRSRKTAAVRTGAPRQRKTTTE